jgi:hypothetical protein
MGILEIRERASDYDGDGPWPSLPYIVPASRLGLVAVLQLASKLGRTVDVMDGEDYIVTYCGGTPEWWLPGGHGGSAHRLSSLGWCHECLDEGRGYVHHLNYAIEVAVLSVEAADDSVLREMCEADGLSPLEYAMEVAGRAVPKDWDRSRAVEVHSLGSDSEAGTATFVVDMKDMTCWRVTVPMAAGAPAAAIELAEQLAHDALPPRCHQCRGTRGHSERCGVTKDRKMAAEYPELFAEHPVIDPLESSA